MISEEEEIKEEKDIFEIEEVEDEVTNNQYKYNGNFEYNNDDDEIIEDRELYEEQQDYKQQDQIYQNGEYMYQEVDEQELDKPIIQMIEKQNYFQEQFLPQNFEPEFFCQLLQQEKDFRNIGVFGDYLSGKTKLLDKLIGSQTNSEFINKQKNLADFWQIEKDKKMTVFSKPVNIMFEAQDKKNYLVTIFDTPGHTDLYDETTSVMESIDSAIFVIDVIQGMTMHAKNILNDLLQQNIPIIFILNKMDRFIQEMRILPEDQYMIIEQLIYELEQYGADLNTNIYFSSFKYDFIFCLKDFYDLYFKDVVTTDQYSDILFGECFWNQELQQFSEQKDAQNERTFVSFILNPIYKIFSNIISQNVENLQTFFDDLDIDIPIKELQNLELKQLIQKVYKLKFYFIQSLYNTLIYSTPVSSVKNQQLLQLYTHQQELQLDQQDLVLQVIKYEPLFQKDEKIIYNFNLYVRILQGQIIKGSTRIKQQVIQDIQCTTIGDQKINLQQANTGNIVLLQNIDINLKEKILCNKPQQFNIVDNFHNGSFFTVSLEPFLPNQMYIFQRGLEKLKKLMLGIQVITQETGQYQLLGRGEVQLDIAMFFIREILEIQEIRISDPYVQFAESILQTSQVMPEVKTIDQQSSFQFLAEPIQEVFYENFKNLKNLNQKQLQQELKHKLNIDQFTINSLWGLNNHDDHPTIFLEQSLLPRQVKQNLLKYKDTIIQGFQWAVNKGPLCQSPIRDCEFKLINFNINDNIQASQLVPAIQKGIHSAMLLSQPCLKEPIYKFEIITIKEALSTIYEIISKRRGQIHEENQLPGFSYLRLNGYIPILDSFGLETDIKAQTLGQAQISKIFCKWDVVPGDPLNTKAKLKKLEPAQPLSLARDILLKTRRRYGLTDEISLVKYFSDEQNIINLINN